MSPPILSAIFASACLFNFGTISDSAAQWAGTGTEADPYLVSNAAELRAIALDNDEWDNHFLLTADIDMAGTGISPAIGTGDGFLGVIDGGGFVIENLVSDNVGIVALNVGTIRNLGVRNADLDFNGARYAGIIASTNIGLIEDCFVEGGSIVGGAATGGIVGLNNHGGRIHQCWSSCSLFPAGTGLPAEFGGGIAGVNSSRIIGCRWSGIVIGEGINGGIAGDNQSLIAYCYANGLAQRDADFGGIAGSNSVNIFHCYSTAALDDSAAGAKAGGLVANQHPDRGGSTASFWDTEASGINTDFSGGSGLNTAAMQDPATFAAAGWEVAGTATGDSPLWVAPAGGGYLQLSWEFEPPPASNFAGGSGTLADPYLIATAAQFRSIGRRIELLRSNYRVTADLDFSAAPNPTAGNRWLSFTGSFDGGNHTLSGLSFDADGQTNAGLFASTTGATLSDIVIDSPVINGPEVSGGSLVASAFDTRIDNITVTNPVVSGRSGSDFGGLVGSIYGGSIRDCHSIGGSVNTDPEGGGGTTGGLAGTVGRNMAVERCTSSTGVSGRGSTGGLIGTTSGTFVTVSDCRATGPVASIYSGGGFIGQIGGIGLGVLPGRPIIERCSATGDVTGQRNLGGFVGDDGGGSCRQCFATGDVTGTGNDIGGFLGSKFRGLVYFDCYALGAASGQERVGGFVGSHYSRLDEADFLTCYAAGAVSGTGDVGGFIGVLTSPSYFPLVSSFWDMATSGTVISDGAIGLWTGSMQSRTTFEQRGWDFNSTWTIAPGEYPRLQWDSGNLFDDTDGDGMSDAWEAQFTADITTFHGEDDADSDGITNEDEYEHGTNALSSDSDGDGYTDLYELSQLMNPNDASSRPSVLTQRLVPSDPPNEVLRFGHDVAISGNTIVVGAPGSVPGQVAPKIITIPGATDHRSPGVVYVFRRTLTATGPRWVQILTLEPTDAEDIGFGSSVDIDGNTVAVGCWNTAAYVFDIDSPAQSARFDVSWDDPEADLGPPQIDTTLDVALHGDTMLVGSPTDNESGFEAGAVFFFEFQGGSWELVNKVFGDDPKFANRFGVAVSLWGRNAAIGSGPYVPGNNHLFSGNVQIYRNPRLAGGWGFEKQIEMPMALQNTISRFGSELSIHRGFLAASGINSNNDGDYQPTAASLFHRHAGGFADWGEIATPYFHFGGDNLEGCFCYEGPFKVATRGRTMLIGTTRGTYIMQRRFLDFENWELAREYYPEMLTAPTDTGESPYGSAVDLSGVFIVAGAAASDAAWVTPLNEPAPFLEWLATFFTEAQMEEPEIAALSADPDDDGLNNELEFALGLDPTTADEDDDFLPSISFAAEGQPGAESLAFTFSLPEPMPAGITHIVQASRNLVDWESIATRTADNTWMGPASISEHVAADGRLCVTVHDTVELSENATRYLRLGVQVSD